MSETVAVLVFDLTHSIFEFASCFGFRAFGIWLGHRFVLGTTFQNPPDAFLAGLVGLLENFALGVLNFI